MVKIINGKEIADKINKQTAKEIFKLNGQRPNLAIILIGDREDSKLYVSLKEKKAKEVGIDTHLYKCPDNISEREVFEIIDFLNKDQSIDAILIQLPLPNGFDTDGLIYAIDPAKDVDRFHPKNLEKLFASCEHNDFLPPLGEAILEILDNIHCVLINKKIGVLYNSEIFGKGLEKIFACRKAMVELIKNADKNLINKTNKADILISAIGKPNFIKGDMIKEGAILIDIGITKKDGKILGDVDFESVKNKASYLTPVPGGIGPVTIAMLFRNTFKLFCKPPTH